MNIIHKTIWRALGAAAVLTLAAGCGVDDVTPKTDTSTVDAADTHVEDTHVEDTHVEDTHVEDTRVEDTHIDDVNLPDADVATEDTGPDTSEDTADTTVEDIAADTSGDAADTGEADTLAPIPNVVINEVAAAGDPDDWVELYNGESAAVDLAGWRFRDDDETHGYVFPTGTSIAAGGYLVVERGVDGFDFGLGGADSAVLFDDADRLVDSTTWLDGESPSGGSWGRFPNGTGEFSRRWVASKGSENLENPTVFCGDGAVTGDEVCDGDDFGGLTCGRWGWGGGSLACEDGCQAVSQAGCTERAPGLVINEVTSAGDDMIELYNGTGAAIDLTGYKLIDDGDNEYTIPSGAIEAGGYRVFVKGTDHAFGLGGDDAVTLQDAGGAVVDVADWESGEATTSYCREPNGVGGFRACAAQTFGATNTP